MISKDQECLFGRIAQVLKRHADSKGLAVWCGNSDGYLEPKNIKYKIAVAYLSDGEKGKPDPLLVSVVVGMDQQGSIHIQSDDRYAFVYTEFQALKFINEIFSTMISFQSE